MKIHSMIKLALAFAMALSIEVSAGAQGQAKFRWMTKVSGFQKIHPVVKLADGTMLVGDWADGSGVD